jgi:porin
LWLPYNPPSKINNNPLAESARNCFYRAMKALRRSGLPRERKSKFSLQLVLGFALLLSAARAQAPQLPGPESAPTARPGSVPPLFNQDYLLGTFWGERSRLADDGLTLRPIYSAETFGNPIGGGKQGETYEGLLDLELDLDLKKMAGWDGAFHISSYFPMGRSLTDNYTGDLFRVSDIDSYNTILLFEAYYEQRFADDKMSVRLGQLSADTEFFISTAAADFLNSTYGWPAILGNNVPAPNYPYAAPGIRLQLSPDEHWTFRAAVYAGDPAPDRIGDPNPNRAPGSNYDDSGTAFNIEGSDGFFNIDELVYNLNQGARDTGLPGTYKIGGWVHTGTFSNLRENNNGQPLASAGSDDHPQAVDGNHGFYFVADQTVWQDKTRPDQPRNVETFLRGGNAEGDRSTFDYYFDGGVVFNGFIPGRPADVVGVATAYGHIGSAVAGEAQGEDGLDGTNTPIPDYEANIELTYFAQIAKWWTVQPDLQVLLHPGGSTAIPNALVLGVRTTVTF